MAISNAGTMPHEADKLQLTAMKNEMEVLHDSVADLVNQSPAANVNGGYF